MELCMIGLGKMGANMTERLTKAGHRVVGYAPHPESVQRVVDVGAAGAESIEDLASQLEPPRAVWIMVPAGDPVDSTIQSLLPHLSKGDIIIDGGKSDYHDTRRRAEECSTAGYHLIDVGTSGGIWGLTEGYSMMVGGADEAVERLRPIFEALAPAPHQGWGHTGPASSGHFVKMVHNAIEYGLMESYAEGFALIKAKEEFDLDLHHIAEIWRYGSVVRSWLLDLTSQAFKDNPDMEGIAPFVPDSGEGRWTVFESIKLDVPAPVIALSLMKRIRSRDEFDYTDRVLSAMRHQFGGHAIKPAN